MLIFFYWRPVKYVKGAARNIKPPIYSKDNLRLGPLQLYSFMFLQSSVLTFGYISDIIVV